MRATQFCFLATAGLLFVNLTASAQHPLVPTAPDACGPGSYCVGGCGAVYGPNYNVYPPFPPFNGMILAPKGQAQGGQVVLKPCVVYDQYGRPHVQYRYVQLPPAPPSFPSHPFARSPRDFFMVD